MNDEKPTRPPFLSTAMWLAAFILLAVLSLKTVQSANNGREDAREDARKAVIIADQLQEQLNCTVRVLTRGVTGVVDNAIEQNDVLLASAEAADRNQVIQDLKNSRTRLAEISEAARAAEQECTK